MHAVAGAQAFLDPAEQRRQGVAARRHGEIIGAEYLMYHGVIGCQPGRAGAGEPPVASDLVGELAGIGAGLGGPRPW